MQKYNLAIFFISLFFISSINTSYSQNGWFTQYSTNLDRSSKSIFFINAQTGWVVQDSNFVYKTTSGGLIWVTYQLPKKCQLESIRFINENTGWVCGGKYGPSNMFNEGHYFKTTNGGINWISYGPVVMTFYKDVCFANENTGFLAIESSQDFKSGGSISKTTNSGINWNPAFEFSLYRNFGFSEIKFINQTTGYALGNYWNDTGGDSVLILKTINAGENWVKVFQSPRIGASFSRKTFYAHGNSIWFLAYNKMIYSTNAGSTWSEISMNNLSFNSKIFFTNQNTGWITKFASASDSLNLLKTTNGGLNWTGYRNPLGNMQEIFFINEYTGWATTINLGGVNILKSITGGITDVEIITQPFITSYQLHQNYPNPFNPVTKIRFEVSNYKPISHVQLNIYDISGKLVSKLVNGDFKGGIYEINWNGENLPSGTYFYSFISGDFKQVRKMILMR